ncbi:MAG TPA: hypothetical protein VF506_08955 [Streptosporangiaceae bacterium]
MTEAGYGLVLPFDTDDAEFTRGFEAGTLWQRLEAGEHPLSATVHSTNAEMVMRIAEAKGVRFSAELTDYDEWLFVTFFADGDPA